MKWSDWVQHTGDDSFPDLGPRSVMEVEVRSGQRILCAEASSAGGTCGCCHVVSWFWDEEDPLPKDVLRYRLLVVED